MSSRRGYCDHCGKYCPIELEPSLRDDQTARDNALDEVFDDGLDQTNLFVLTDHDFHGSPCLGNGRHPVHLEL